MASPSDTPPDDKPPNPVSHVTQPTIDNNQDANVAAPKEISPPSVFVNSEPIREDQVQNAVKFLSHPKVRGSPVMYRRSFLERKGLTKEEIDEAFRRVPDPTPAVSASQPAVANQDGQAKPSSNVQQQTSSQALQTTQAGQLGSLSKIGMLSRFHWSHALIAVGFLAVSGAGTAVLFKKTIIPRLKSWIRRVVSEEEEEEGLLNKKDKKPSIAEEAAAAAKSAAAAAADVAQASQEMLITKTEEKRSFEELVRMLNVQVHEMKSMSNAIQKLEGGQNVRERNFLEERDDQRVSLTNSRQLYANGKTETDSRSVSYAVRSVSPPAAVEPSVAPHPKSYMEIMAMIQRGEKPSNIREINDAPPNPNQPVSNPRVVPRPKPWEVSQAPTNNFPSQEITNGSSYELADNQVNAADGVPWWQRKNVRITEIEADGENKFGSSSAPSNERAPVQRSWVPPQPPPVVMPEAAAAIRQPKKPYQQEQQMTDDELLARSADITDELTRVTKISESGGAVDMNSENSGLGSTEIRKEENGSYVEASA